MLKREYAVIRQRYYPKWLLVVCVKLHIHACLSSQCVPPCTTLKNPGFLPCLILCTCRLHRPSSGGVKGDAGSPTMIPTY